MPVRPLSMIFSGSSAAAESAETVDSVPVFPFSHSRTDSTYSLAHSRRASIRRTNSTRNSKDIIPLVLKVEQKSATATTQTAAPARGHSRGLSMGMYRPDSTAAQEQTAKRPGGMFFGRMFPAKEAEAKSTTCNSSTTHLQADSDSVSDGSYQPRERSSRNAAGASPHVPRCPGSPLRSSSRTSVDSSPNFPAIAHRGQVAISPCSCSAEKARLELRLNGRVSEMETTLEIRDLTISMLTEQLDDKDQEIDLLRQRMAVLEKALMGSSLPAALDSPMPRIECEFGLDEGIGSSEGVGSSASVSSRPASRMETIPTSSESSSLDKQRKRISLNSIDPEISYDDLIDENVALKEEVVRLNGVLEDGLGALADLGL